MKKCEHANVFVYPYSLSSMNINVINCQQFLQTCNDTFSQLDFEASSLRQVIAGFTPKSSAKALGFYLFIYFLEVFKIQSKLLTVVSHLCYYHVAVLIKHYFFSFTPQVTFRLEFEFSNSVLLDHIRLILQVTRQDTANIQPV